MTTMKISTSQFIICDILLNNNQQVLCIQKKRRSCAAHVQVLPPQTSNGNMKATDQMHVSQEVLRPLPSVNKVLAVVIGIPSGCSSDTQIPFSDSRARAAPRTSARHVISSVLVSPVASAPAIATTPICKACKDTIALTNVTYS